MKKYLFGLFAIALAIGFSSFKSAKTTSHYLFTTPSDQFAQIGLVETETAWELVGEIGEAEPSCAASYKACEVVVDETETFVDPNDDLRKIREDAIIDAERVGSTQYLKVVSYTKADAGSDNTLIYSAPQ